MRTTRLTPAAAVLAAAIASCTIDGDGVTDVDDPLEDVETSRVGLSGPSKSGRHQPAWKRGRDVWFEATFGGERFFSLVLPHAPFHLPLGFDAVLTSDRDTRFSTWGVINDPGCTQGDATTDFLDRCDDPESSGVIGIRKRKNRSPTGPKWLFGVTCAACHAGLDPENPPKDPNHPKWSNIHPTVGNQFLQVGKIFNVHLSTHDPRYHVFASWAPGTVDTTAIESDGINNPGMITPIWDVPLRPFFQQHDGGKKIVVHRSGQGGEDSVGCEKAAMRVYFNIGMCAVECVLPHLANGPGGSQTPIDVDQCRRDCADFRAAEKAVGDLCAFLDRPRPPRLVDAPKGWKLVDWSMVKRGEVVFQKACASCHSNGRRENKDVLSNDELLVASGFDGVAGEPLGAIGTNRCRALTTNWMAGRIWAPFSSDEYKARPTGGPGYYRVMPLRGAWATAPFFHNNRLGPYNGDPSVAGRIAAFEAAMHELLNPRSRDFAASIQRTTDSVTLPSGVTLPAGTPVNAYANVDPSDPTKNRCDEVVENGGHYFGASLSHTDKRALVEYLKTR